MNPVFPPSTQPLESALAGLLVVDFTHYIAGPVATMMLGDLGATIVKIENARGGDAMRHFPPADDRLGGEGAAFLWANRNKRSVALDLKTEAGLAIAKQLIARADIVVENFSAEVMSKMGLNYDSVKEDNPGLIYCSVSAYGRSGEFAGKTGFDPVAQAESGFMSLNGYPDRPGVRSGAPVMDISTGMMACNAILAAVAARYRTGVGQHVGVALFDTAFMMNGYTTTQSIFNGYERQRDGNGSMDAVPTGVFQASDGPFLIVCGSTPIFKRLFTLVANMPEIADDPELQTSTGRRQHRDRIVGVLQALFETRTRDHWIDKLQAAAVPAGVARSIAEAIASPQVAARGLVGAVAHPTAGQVPDIASPMQLSRTPVVTPVAAPTMGQHTEEVLAELLHWDGRELAKARGNGAFGQSVEQA